jgi:hypothetical protein
MMTPNHLEHQGFIQVDGNLRAVHRAGHRKGRPRPQHHAQIEHAAAVEAASATNSRKKIATRLVPLATLPATPKDHKRQGHQRTAAARGFTNHHKAPASHDEG